MKLSNKPILTTTIKNGRTTSGDNCDSIDGNDGGGSEVIEDDMMEMIAALARC